jgi:hypothetical protein
MAIGKLPPSNATPGNPHRMRFTLKHKLSHRCRRVDGLLIQVEIDADRLTMLDRAQQINERGSEPVDASRRMG